MSELTLEALQADIDIARKYAMYARPFEAPESPDWTPAELEIARAQAHQYLMTKAIEIPLDIYLDDVPTALGREYEPLLRKDD